MEVSPTFDLSACTRVWRLCVVLAHAWRTLALGRVSRASLVHMSLMRSLVFLVLFAHACRLHVTCVSLMRVARAHLVNVTHEFLVCRSCVPRSCCTCVSLVCSFLMHVALACISFVFLAHSLCVLFLRSPCVPRACPPCIPYMCHSCIFCACCVCVRLTFFISVAR